MDTFAIRFKYLRKSENLTQTEIAKILDTTNSSICDWECQRSEPSLFMLAKICYFFKISADYLIGLEDETGGKTYNNYGVHNGNVKF
jgi:transcriptional regulator, XRE family